MKPKQINDENAEEDKKLVLRKPLNTKLQRVKVILDTLPDGVRYIGPDQLLSPKFILKLTGRGNVLLSTEDAKILTNLKQENMTSNNVALEDNEFVLGLFAFQLTCITRSQLKQMRFIVSKSEFKVLAKLHKILKDVRLDQRIDCLLQANLQLEQENKKLMEVLRKSRIYTHNHRHHQTYKASSLGAADLFASNSLAISPRTQVTLPCMLNDADETGRVIHSAPNTPRQPQATSFSSELFL